MPGKVETSGLAIHLEYGNVVGSLITAIEELAGGIEVETAGITPARRFFLDKAQRSVLSDGEYSDAVM